ncbi:MAG TPA: hypothetical protein VKT81_05830 [Bryobacteraceae bacterium]|nr:hypothetical protein [Bryobacteraceae bacterium]
MTYDFLQDEQALRQFIAEFEQGTLAKPVWTHAAHLAVGAWYLLSLPHEAAVEQVRTGIVHYNECVGTANTPDSGYHETLTMFWLQRIGEFLKARGSGAGKLAAIQEVVAEFGSQRDLFKKYYSFDVVASREARAGWLAPDRIV